MKKTRNLPIRLKNALRGAPNPHLALSSLRPSISPKDYEALIHFLPTITRGGKGSLNPAFPTMYPDLAKRQRVLHPVSLEREFLWTATRIVQHAEKLNNYLSLKQEFESHLMRGHSELAEHSLNAIEAACGVSFYLIATRLALLQQARGLEQQKLFLASIRDQVSSGMVPFISFWISQKNEPATNPIIFPERFLNALIRNNLPPDLANYIGFMVLGLPPDTDEISSLLRWGQTAAIIDQYETLISAMTASINSIDLFLPSLRLLQDHINDQRLDRIGFICGHWCPAKIPPMLITSV